MHIALPDLDSQVLILNLLAQKENRSFQFLFFFNFSCKNEETGNEC